MGVAGEHQRFGEYISQEPSPLFGEHAGILMDPATSEQIRVAGGAFVTDSSGRRIDLVDGIPNFFVPAGWDPKSPLQDVTEMVKAFYEETPFPNYDGFDSRESLSTKARRGITSDAPFWRQGRRPVHHDRAQAPAR